MRGAASVGQMCVLLVSTLLHYGCTAHCRLAVHGGASLEALAEICPPPFRCSLLRCSSGQRGKFFPAVSLPSGDRPIEIVLAPLTEQRVRSLHPLAKIQHSKPNRDSAPAKGRSSASSAFQSREYTRAPPNCNNKH